MDRSPADVKLLAACWLHDEEMARSLLARHPRLAADLPEVDRRQAAHAARNNDLPALRLMLRAGLSVSARSQHRATTLHWAAWHGNAEMVELILHHHPSIEDAENDFHGTPLGWAIHGSQHGWYVKTGNYPRTVELLLAAGAKPPSQAGGTEAVQEVLRRPRP
jgi:hypothetical protein